MTGKQLSLFTEGAGHAKLKLDLDHLAVESFTPESIRRESDGTVHAHAPTRNANTCNNFSCQAGCTFDESCYNPCTTG